MTSPKEDPHSNKAQANVLGVAVDAVNMTGAMDRIVSILDAGKRGYVCVAGVHGVMEAQRSKELSAVYDHAIMTVPDGMPLVWVGRLQGHATMERVTGPDVMLEVFADRRLSSLKHFFYGGEPGVAEDLRARLLQKFPWARVVGTYTPPFRDLNQVEESQFLARIADLKPDILWVGIGCPRQEIFMARYVARLDTRLIFGVGAAFDYHTGRIRDCAPWIKHAGLQWLHRLIQHPRRLWKRYLRNNPAFVWRISLQIIRNHVASGVRRRVSAGADTSSAPSRKKATQC